MSQSTHNPRSIKNLPPPLASPRITRRTFLKISAALMAAYTVGIEPGTLRVRQVTVPVPALPQALEGFTIAQLSDTHRSPLMPRQRIERAVAALSDTNPDLVALTGDYVSYWANYALEYPDLLAPLAPPAGLFACLGNHDHWTDPTLVTDALRAAGVTVLRNQHHTISVGTAQLCIIGIDDVGYAGISGHHAPPADDLPAALAGSPWHGPIRVLLAHNPDFVMSAAFAQESARRPIHLVLSGHMHGGQVCIPFLGPLYIPSRYGRLFAGGLVEAAGTHVHVSRGAGSTWPVRFNCPPEVNLLTLRAA